MLPRLLFLAICQAAHAFCHSQVLLAPATQSTAPRAAPHGRFLHITDLHPDRHYRSKASVSSSCHHKKPKKEAERAGYWGTPWRKCDTPLRLMNLTLDYLDATWAREIDFVIWTGDNVRHDNDRKIPRTTVEIYELNREVARRMAEIFSKRGVPVVPSIGNNDIWPHNILAPGPNAITKEYADIWQSFIPFSSYQVFQRGAYFSTELILNSLAAVSLNTLYFYDSNKAVGGCTYKDANDPGNLQFAWLDVQLQAFRSRGMQVWLTGHVPPTAKNYFPECFRRYVEISLRFQDTIVGHLYGHMNIDHFYFLDAQALVQPPESAEGWLTKKALHKRLRREFRKLPSKSAVDYDEYAVVNVAPSLVTNPYVPALRVFSYNVTGYTDSYAEAEKKKKGSKRKHSHRDDCKKDDKRWGCRLPHEKWHSDAESPSRKNTLWSPLGYSQFYMPGLGASSKGEAPGWELEYVTYRQNGSVLAPYELEDLTIGSWFGLAKRLGEKEGLWKRFKRHMYLEG